MLSFSVFDQAKACLLVSSIEKKIHLSRSCQTLRDQGLLDYSCQSSLDTDTGAVMVAGRPARPQLVSPKELAKRRAGSNEGKASLYHALAHIEFNAINMAWDAVYRFRGLPEAYYRDWIQVAVEEAYHFELLRGHLLTLGYDYGDFPAHNGLWDMAVKTAHDPLVRMALVPRTLEARGLDANPAIRDKVLAAGDKRGADILDIILRDEIGHVAIGDRWFRYLCRQRDLDAEKTYTGLVDQYMEGRLRGPFHTEARKQAGFSEKELEKLGM